MSLTFSYSELEINRDNNSEENQRSIDPACVITQQPSANKIQSSNDDHKKCCSSIEFCNCMEVTCKCLECLGACLQCLAACA